MDKQNNKQDMKLRAMSVYFQHWGKEEIQKHIQRKGQERTCRVIRKNYLYCVTPYRMSQYTDDISKATLFRTLMFEGEPPESVFIKMKELAEALLESTPYVPSGCLEGHDYEYPRFLKKQNRVIGRTIMTYPNSFPYSFHSEKQKASMRRVDAIISFLN
uniref:Uncharacterized protein n=1 Tax=viral metagenome TaxID=1070528 RepID=A0A6C0D1D2_9ZZZZ